MQHQVGTGVFTGVGISAKSENMSLIMFPFYKNHIINELKWAWQDDTQSLPTCVKPS